MVFSVLLWITSKAGLLGLPLTLILLSWLFKYAYILFDHTVRGFDDPPALDIQWLNPVDEFRPLVQLLILSVVLGAAYSIGHAVGRPAGLGFLVIVATVLQASAAILGLEGSALRALNPAAIGRLIAALGGLYALVLAVIAAYTAAWMMLSQLAVPSWLLTPAWMFALLSVYSLLAGVMYERRDPLGLEAWRSPERTEARRLQGEARRNDVMITDAYGLVRAGRHTETWENLQSWLAARGHDDADYRWLCARTATWTDARYVTRLTEEFIERLLARKKTGEALDLATQRLRIDPSFRPKTAASTLYLAELAVQGGGAPSVARALLGDFAARFPGDPRIISAQRLAQVL